MDEAVPAAELPCAKRDSTWRRVRFRIVDSKGRGVEGARLALYQGLSFFEIASVTSAVTGPSGEVELVVPARDLIVSVTRRRFARLLERFDLVTPKAGILKLSLEKGRSLKGKVTGEEGGPLAGATVAVLSHIQRYFLRRSAASSLVTLLIRGGQRMYSLDLLEAGLAEQTRALTDSEGRFILSGLPAPLFEDDRLLERGQMYISAPGHYPRVLSMSGCRSGALAVRLTRARHGIRGAVLSDTGEPLPGCYIFAASARAHVPEGFELYRTKDESGEDVPVSRPWFTGPTGPDGTYFLPSPPGEDELKYVVCIKPGWIPSVIRDVSVRGTGENGFEIHLRKGGAISVVVTAAGKKVPARIRAGRSNVPTVLEGFFDMTLGTKGPQGLAVTGVGRPPFYLRVDSAGHAPHVEWVRDSRATVRVRLSPGRTVGGRITDKDTGEGLAGAEVRATLIADTVDLGNPDFIAHRSTFTGPDGRFELKQVPADFPLGRIRVFWMGEPVGERELPRGVSIIDIPVRVDRAREGGQ
jgi:hypothetical protein